MGQVGAGRKAAPHLPALRATQRVHVHLEPAVARVTAGYHVAPPQVLAVGHDHTRGIAVPHDAAVQLDAAPPLAQAEMTTVGSRPQHHHVDGDPAPVEAEHVEDGRGPYALPRVRQTQRTRDVAGRVGDKAHGDAGVSRDHLSERGIAAVRHNHIGTRAVAHDVTTLAAWITPRRHASIADLAVCLVSASGATSET